MTTAFERGESVRQAVAWNLLDPGIVSLSPARQSIRDELTQY
jgi:hypothetical protein